MAKIPDFITIDVEPRIYVSEKTAETCLRLLEAFMNTHPDKRIIANRADNGEITLEIHTTQEVVDGPR